MVDRAQPAVHHLGRVVDRAAGDVGERLVAEADTEHRHLGALEHVQRDADVALALGASRARRDHDVVHRQRSELLPRQLVVAHDDRLIAVDLAQQVEEVEGERVVVVDQERAHARIYTLPTLAQERLRLRELRQRGVQTVILAGADTHGIMRGKRVPIAELDRAAERGVALSDVVWALPVDEHEPVQPPPEHTDYFPRPGYPDMRAVPDLETARIVPWHDRTALLLCDFVDHDGGAIPLSPRAVLRSVVERARSMGVEPIVGVELEFYVLRETPQSVLGKRPSQLVAVDERPSVYGIVAASRNEPFAGAVRETLLRYGLAVEACNPEAGPGQFEINLRAAPALQAADEAFLLKSAVKEVAARQDLLATFVPKPRSEWPGSSCHLHISLG